MSSDNIVYNVYRQERSSLASKVTNLR